MRRAERRQKASLMDQAMMVEAILSGAPIVRCRICWGKHPIVADEGGDMGHSVETVSISGNKAQVIVRAPIAKAAKTYHILRDDAKSSLWRASSGVTFEQTSERTFRIW
jgi:hypothetical protein